MSSSSRRRKAPEDVPMELPSSESEFDESFNSGDGGDDIDVDDEDDN